MIVMARRARVIRFPRPPAREPDATPGFVEVRRCRHQAEALVVRSLLESEGIRVVLRSNLAQSVHPFSVGDQGEIVILAPEHDAPRARTILIRLIR
jgi:putative signal transducing protein